MVTFWVAQSLIFSLGVGVIEHFESVDEFLERNKIDNLKQVELV